MMKKIKVPCFIWIPVKAVHACLWPSSYCQQIKRLQKGHLTYQNQPQRDRGSPPLNKKIYIVFPDLPG